MNIGKNDYILGVWYCERTRGEHQGYSLMVASKNQEGQWFINIRNRFDEGRIKEQIITFRDSPDGPTMIERGKIFFEVASQFFPDLKEYIDVKGDYIKMIFMVAMNDKLVLKENIESIFTDKRV